MKDGVFRYDLSDVVTRTVPGRYGIIAMVSVPANSHKSHCIHVKYGLYHDV